MDAVRKKKVLFLCTHNSARSQMAEGLLNALFGNTYIGLSAGTEPTTVNRYAIEVMKEIGIDIAGNKAKGVDELTGIDFDLVVTVCDNAKEACPYLPGIHRMLHKGFPDPASATGPDSEIVKTFRETRDMIRAWIMDTFGHENT